jgi:hypothetical protein
VGVEARCGELQGSDFAGLGRPGSDFRVCGIRVSGDGPEAALDGLGEVVAVEGRAVLVPQLREPPRRRPVQQGRLSEFMVQSSSASDF